MWGYGGSISREEVLLGLITDAQDVVIGETDYTKLTPTGNFGANTTHVKEYIDFVLKMVLMLY